MGSFFFFAGSVLTLVISALTFLMGGARSEDGVIRREATPIVAGLLTSGVLIVVGSWLMNQESGREAAVRHSNVVAEMFENSQRVAPADIRVVIEFHVVPTVVSKIPTELKEFWVLTLHALPKGCNVKPEGSDNLGSHLLPEFNHLPEAINVTASSHRPQVVNVHNQYDVFESQVSFFTDFVGDLRDLARACEWNGSVIELSAMARNKGPQLQGWFEKHGMDVEDPAAFIEEFNLTPGDGDDIRQVIAEFPHFGDTGIDVTANLFVGSRFVGKASGSLLWRTERGGDSNDAVIKFHRINVKDDCFPTPPAREPVERAKLELGVIGVCVLLLIVSMSTTGLALTRYWTS